MCHSQCLQGRLFMAAHPISVHTLKPRCLFPQLKLQKNKVLPQKLGENSHPNFCPGASLWYPKSCPPTPSAMWLCLQPRWRRLRRLYWRRPLWLSAPQGALRKTGATSGFAIWIGFCTKLQQHTKTTNEMKHQWVPGNPKPRAIRPVDQ